MRKIEVKGTIVGNADKWIYEWFGMDATCPKDVNAAISEANGEPLLVEINSGGGDVFAGSEIYTALKAYAGTVEINIVGLAASAASVIAQAGHSRISPPCVSSKMQRQRNRVLSGRLSYKSADRRSNLP